MGIKGLTKLLQEKAPRCIKEKKFQEYFGQKVAIDASMSLYQFLIAIRHGGDQDGRYNYQNLTTETGEVTSHLQGMFYRTIRLLDAGIKPVMIFDGKPEVLKSTELAKRREAKQKAEEQLEEAREAGRQEDVEKFTKSSTVVTQQQYDDVKQLLTLMGLPIVRAPGEAEAQAAALTRANKVHGTATEDMDALTFGSPRLIRNLTFSFAGQKQEFAYEYNLDVCLAELKMTMPQFVDLCILLGCDFAPKIKGIGPTAAYNLIEKYGSIDRAMPHLKSKYDIPDDWPAVVKEAQRIFNEPLVDDPSNIQLQWLEPDYEGLTKYLVDEKGFNADRVAKAIDRLRKYRHRASQQRLESFFTPTTSPNKSSGDSSSSSKDAGKKQAAPSKKRNMGTLGARGKPKSKKLKEDDDDEQKSGKSTPSKSSTANGKNVAASALSSSNSADDENDDLDDGLVFHPAAGSSDDDED